MATFGNTASGSTFDTIGTDGSILAKFTLSDNATVTKISALMDRIGSNVNVKAFIYDATGSTLSGDGASAGTQKGVTNATSINVAHGSASWFDFTFASPVLLAPGDYWLGVVSQGSSTAALYINTSGGNAQLRSSTTYATPANPWSFTTGHQSYLVSIYATYTTIDPISISVSDSTTLSESFVGTAINPGVVNVLGFENIVISEPVTLTRTNLPHRVRAFYIVPNDRTYNATYENLLLEAWKAARQFFGLSFQNGFTFGTPPDSIVTVLFPPDSAATIQADYYTYLPTLVNNWATANGEPSTSRFLVVADTNPTGLGGRASGRVAMLSPSELIEPDSGTISVAVHELAHAYFTNHSGNGSIMDGANLTPSSTWGPYETTGPFGPTVTVQASFASDTRFFCQAHITRLLSASWTLPITFAEPFGATPLSLSVSDSTTVSEFVTMISFSGNERKVFGQEVITVSDTIAPGILSIQVSDTATIDEVGIDGQGTLVLVFSSIFSVDNPITVTDSIPPHYQDVITVNESVGYYQDAVFVRDNVFFTINGAYSVDIENIKIQGLRIIGD